MRISAVESFNFYNQNYPNGNQKMFSPKFGDVLFPFDLEHSVSSGVRWSVRKLKIMARNNEQMKDLAEYLHNLKKSELTDLYNDHDGFWSLFKNEKNLKSVKVKAKLEPYLKMVRESKEKCRAIMNELKAKSFWTDEDRAVYNANKAEIERLNKKAGEESKFHAMF